MGLVLVLALMVRNFMQATIRSELAARGETLAHPFTKKPEKSLTPEMAFEHFAAVLGQVVRLGEHARRMPARLSPPAVQILSLFRFDDRIFEVPEVRGPKWVDRPSGTPGM